MVPLVPWSPPGRAVRWLWLWYLSRFSAHQTGLRHEQQTIEMHRRQDEIASFEAFFLRFDRRIAGFLWRMTGDEQLANELGQETFLRAWQHFTEIMAYDRPEGWLFRVATNLALQHLRQRHVIQAISWDTLSLSTPGDLATEWIERETVRQTLLALPPRLRAALVLREIYGLSCAEVGLALGISRNAAKIALWRAREQF